MGILDPQRIETARRLVEWVRPVRGAPIDARRTTSPSDVLKQNVNFFKNRKTFKRSFHLEESGQVLQLGNVHGAADVRVVPSALSWPVICPAEHFLT